MTGPTGRSGRAVAVVLVVVVLAGCSAVGNLPFDVEIQTSETGEPVQVVVKYVIDGDTVVVQFPDGHEDTVRLLGIDAPESGDTNPAEFEGVPDTDAGRQCLRNWAQKATTYLENRVAGRVVTLKFDALADRRGAYDRLLAYVIVDNTTVNRQLIAQGYARLYDSTFEVASTYAALEADAMAANRGLWQCQTL